MVLTNVSASDKGLYVCFAAVTPSQILEYEEQKENNDTSFNEQNNKQIDNDKVEQADKNDEREEQQVLLTSTTSKTKHYNDTTTTTTTTYVKPLIEIFNNDDRKLTKTQTQNASTTSMLPMPNVTTTATKTPKSTISISASDSASASASASATETTIVINTLSKANFSTSISSTYHNNNSSSSSSSSSAINSSNTSSKSNSSSSKSSVSSSNDIYLTTLTPVSSSTIDDIEEQEFQAFEKINLTVRTPPGPVTKLYFKASTILGFLVWRFNKTNSGGYPVRSFTAEFRNVSYESPPFNSSFEHKWSRMDPINIAPNVVSQKLNFIALSQFFFIFNKLFHFCKKI